MYVDIDKLKNENWTIVSARSLAACAPFTSKDAVRPILNCIEVETTEKDGTGMTACDSYKLLHCTSKPYGDGWKNPVGTMLVKWSDIKKSKLISARPKPTMWVAMRQVESTWSSTPAIEILVFEHDTLPKEVGRLTIDGVEGTFPKWRQLDSSKSERNAEKQSNVGPGLNTSYLIDVFRSIELAVSDGGAAVTQFVHGTLMQPIHFMASNASGESAFALLMPVRL